MTVVLGVRKPEGVYLGADSASIGGWDHAERRDPKLYEFEYGAFGFTTSYRMGQLLYVEFKRLFTGEPFPYSQGGALDWGITKLIPCLRKALEDGGWSEKKDGREAGGQFMLATSVGDLIAIDPDFQVIVVDTSMALGCGYAFAQGAFTALDDGGPSDTKANVEQALTVSERWCAGVRAPFLVSFIPRAAA